MYRIKNQSGFVGISAVFLTVIVTLIGVVGWLVYDRQKTSKALVVPALVSQQPADKPQAQQQESLKAYQDQVAKIEYSYPSNWKIESEKTPWTEQGWYISSNKITSPSNKVLHINAHYGGKGGYCDPASTDKPHAPGNECPTYEVLSKELVGLKSSSSTSNSATSDVFLLTNKYTQSKSGGSKTEYYMTLDTELYGAIKLNDPVMGAWAPQGTWLFVGNKTGSGNSNSLQLEVSVAGDSRDFLLSAEGQQFKAILKSFRNTQ